MAIISNIFCTVCKQSKQVCHSVSRYPNVCDECEKKQKEDARNQHLAERAALTVEERLALLEGDLYDLARRPKPFDMHTPIG